MSNSRDNPQFKLSKKSYRFIVINTKPMYLNVLFSLFCYRQQNKYEIMKWIPNHEKFDKTNGEVGKRLLKIKERSKIQERICLPTGCRGYSSYFIAEYNRKAIFKTKKNRSCSYFCCKRPEISVQVLDNDFETLDQQNLTDKEKEQLISAFNQKLQDFDDLVLFDSQYIGKATVPWSLFTYESVI